MNAARTPARRVQQLELDLGRNPRGGLRPIAFGNVLRELMPSPTEAHLLCELSSPERQTLYRLAGIQPLEQITYEENLRRWRRGRRAA